MFTTNYLIDTNILIYHTKGSQNTIDFISHLITQHSFYISILTKIEFLGWDKHTPYGFQKCKQLIEFATIYPVDELFPYVDFYKIASYEILWNNLLSACAKTGRPVVLSTGMATLDEVKQAVAILKNAGCKELTLLHCVSGYPTPVAGCNLAAIETMRKSFSYLQSQMNIHFGWSDHSVNPGVIYRAVHRWGAEMIEFHLDLVGVPVILIANYKTDERDMIAFKKLGIALPLGYHEDVSDSTIKQAVENLLKDRVLWEKMSEKGKMLVDGCGAKRIADIVEDCLSAKI